VGATSRERQWSKIWTFPQSEWSKGRKVSNRKADISRIQAREKCPCVTEAQVKNGVQKSPQPCRSECVYVWWTGGWGERGESINPAVMILILFAIVFKSIILLLQFLVFL